MSVIELWCINNIMSFGILCDDLFQDISKNVIKLSEI
jgi:hypothetical protein